MRGPLILLIAVAVGCSVALAPARAAGRDKAYQERCYQAALARQPERAARFDWSRTPAGEKLALLEAGIGAEPECAYLHYLRGVVLDAEIGLRDEALRAFERAVAIVPTFDLAHENIALAHRAEAHRSFGRAALKPDTKEDVFRLTRALAALKQAADLVAGNPLWGRERAGHLLSVIKEVERELAEIKSPAGNADFLGGDLAELVVTNWRANVRSGFGLAFPTEVTLKRGERVKAAVGHRRYGWIKVRLPDGRPGWIYHNLVR